MVTHPRVIPCYLSIYLSIYLLHAAAKVVKGLKWEGILKKEQQMKGLGYAHEQQQ